MKIKEAIRLLQQRDVDEDIMCIFCTTDSVKNTAERRKVTLDDEAISRVLDEVHGACVTEMWKSMGRAVSEYS